jgi:SpoVK/Ycf46/Vps4 family AAA+-type ATPase
MNRRRSISIPRSTQPAKSLARSLFKRLRFQAGRALAPPLLVFVLSSVAHGQGTMDFSGAQTLMGTFKTATAECIANRLVSESKVEDSVLFKLSNRVRGTGKVGEMSSYIAEAFHKLSVAAGKNRRAVLIIDESDSLGASRSQEHSHHEDKVAVNTLIQGIDDLRRHGGRIVTFLCTNRLSVLDPALQRRAAIIEEFLRPDESHRKALLEMDLKGLDISGAQIAELVRITGSHGKLPIWTYSDIRTRWYPAAMSRAFPNRAVNFADLLETAKELTPSPVVEDR